MHSLDPGFYYKLLVPNLVGLGFAADVFNGGERDNVAFMARIGGYTGQLWRFIPTGDGGFALSTLLRGPALCAGVVDEAGEGSVRLSRGVSPDKVWTVEPLAGQDSFAVVPAALAPFVRAGFVRLTTRARGPGWSLNLAAGGEAFMPKLSERSDGPGQMWLLARTEARIH